MSGTCLVGSTEVIRKLPAFGQLPHGYGCVAIEDVNDIDVLSDRLAAVVEDPETAAAIGVRGREFAREVQRGIPFPQPLERILEAAAARQRASSSTTRRSADDAPAHVGSRRFPLTHLVAAAIAEIGGNRHENVNLVLPGRTPDLIWARQVLDTIERGMVDGETSFRPLALAVRVEMAVAMTEDEADKTSSTESFDPLFRLRINRWAMKEGTLAGLVPVRDPQLRIVEFDYDVSQFLGAQTVAAFPAVATPRRSYIVAFGCSDDGRRDPLLVDELTARILQLSDGTRTTSEIVGKLNQEIGTSTIEDNIRWIENLFLLGLLSLRDTRAKAGKTSYYRSYPSTQAN